MSIPNPTGHFPVTACCTLDDKNGTVQFVKVYSWHFTSAWISAPDTVMLRDMLRPRLHDQRGPDGWMGKEGRYWTEENWPSSHCRAGPVDGSRTSAGGSPTAVAKQVRESKGLYGRVPNRSLPFPPLWVSHDTVDCSTFVTSLDTYNHGELAYGALMWPIIGSLNLGLETLLGSVTGVDIVSNNY